MKTWLIIALLLTGCMKFDNQHIGGLETGPAVTRYLNDTDPGAAQPYVYPARWLLGDLKRQMQLANIKWGQTNIINQKGVKIHAQSNQYGLADLDEIWIEMPKVAAASSAAQDKCLGFIARITTATQTYLIINVKEPNKDKGLNETGSIPWTDWNDYPIYTWYGNPVSDRDGFVQSYYETSALSAPTNSNDVTYKFDEKGYARLVVRAGTAFVFPGTVTQLGGEQYTWRWYPTVATDGVHYVEDTDATHLAALTEFYSTANSDFVAGFQSRSDAPTFNNFVDSNAYVTTQLNVNFPTDFVYGLAPTLICQDAVDPVTRYFSSNYALVNDTVVVKAINDNAAFNSFAVCYNGTMTYTVDDALKDKVVGDYIARTLTSTGHHYTVSWGTGGLIWPGPEGVYYIYDKYGIPRSYYFGVGETGTDITDVKNYYQINPWTMTTNLLNGDYDVTVLCPHDNSSHDVTVDIHIFGSQYPDVSYTDTVVNGKSLKKATVHVGKSVDYVKGSTTNPYVTIATL
ncbi:MAG: hypothetical protein ACXWDN_07075 [Limisphaerales bacterium]